MLRRTICASAIAFLIAGPAAAQDTLGVPLNPQRPPTQEEIDKQKAADQAYDAAVQKIPDKKSSSDPWGDVRATSPPASKTKRQKTVVNPQQPQSQQ